MKKIQWIGIICFLITLGVATLLSAGDFAPKNPAVIPTPGKVTLLDLGADQCIPCKMMAPILEELEKEYQGKASIFFIDVRKNPDEARRFGVRSIPTQIFFDKEGKEAGRHVGFLDKKSIVSVLEQLGVPAEEKP